MGLRFLNVSTTLPDMQLARKIALLLTEKKLAASVQMIGPIESHFWWKDKLEEAREWLCLIKTTEDAYPQVEALIVEEHPYEVPEIYAVPLETGYPPYLAWVHRYSHAESFEEET